MPNKYFIQRDLLCGLPGALARKHAADCGRPGPA
jgi:hypothetical protein